MVNYRNVKVPNDLIEGILKLIKEHKELGYRSHTEFVIEATRKHLLKLKELFKREKA